jgi:putative ABC transport system permease protein
VIDQIREITLMNLRNVPSRVFSSAVIVVGIAGVVGVLVAILSMANGFRTALNDTGKPDRAIVMRSIKSGELSSGASREQLEIIRRMEGVVAASGELYLVADVPKRATGTPANLIVRGVQATAFDIRPEVRILAGRRFEPGKRELIVGRGAVEEFAGLEIGNHVAFRDNDWEVVGIFTADGNANESEVWTDLPVAQEAFRRGGSISTIRLALERPDVIDDLAKRIKADRRLELEMMSEPEFYATQSAQLSGLISGFGYVVAVIMAIGAIFAALNTMYTAVSTRTVEIATLRALGFGRVPVVASVMIEALLLAVLGGVLGGAIAYAAFNGVTISTLNNAAFSQIAFDFKVTPDLLSKGFLWATTLGIVGGLFPAVRAARLPITAALRGE